MQHGATDPDTFMMNALMESEKSPFGYLAIAGVIMIVALATSKKAQNVVKTSVDLSRQDEGDEMFGSSGVARALVRNTQKTATVIGGLIPDRAKKWIDSRFNSEAAVLPEGAAFDQIRASVNLVLAGLLVAFGTSMKLPLSTTYVTFMVAMGTSLADRAWNRESAVFRITGVLSVIGGWFITAGAAFIVSFLITNGLFFGSFVAMVIAIIVAITILIHSNLRDTKNNKNSEADKLFSKILYSDDKTECWLLLCNHVKLTTMDNLRFVTLNYETMTTAFFHEDYRTLKHTVAQFDGQRKDIKRQRRKQIIALRRIDPVLSVEKGTWYFLTINSLSQMVYCLKRMGEPCLEYVANNFRPIPGKYVNEFLTLRDEIVRIFRRAISDETTHHIRDDAARIQNALSDYRKRIIRDIQTKQLNIESMTVFLNLVQESQELLSALRHTMRGKNKFEE
jgi:hypothetical protein